MNEASQDRTVLLITGASSGIGEAVAREHVDRGGAVVLGARRVERLRALARELGEDRVAVTATDVTDADSVASLVTLAETRFGALHVVFANAGVGGGGTLLDGDMGKWREILLTNVLGVAITARLALPALLRSGRGHIILTSSVSGRRVSGNHVYSASKHAVHALGEGLRMELVDRVRVTLLAPGMVETELESWDVEVLNAADVARAVAFCIWQPPTVAINELTIRHLRQEF